MLAWTLNAKPVSDRIQPISDFRRGRINRGTIPSVDFPHHYVLSGSATTLWTQLSYLTIPYMYSMNGGFPALPSKPFHPRKTHVKSRSGCDSCKRRRKKCDERLPICSCCFEQGLSCRYEKVNQVSIVSRKESSPPLRSSLIWTGVPGLTTAETKHFNHFHSQTLCTLGSASVQKVIELTLPAAISFDFLKHAVCTLAASHAVFLSEGHDSSVTRYYDKALSTFRQRLTSPISGQDLDAILTSCVLLGMIAFSKPHESATRSQDRLGIAHLRWLTPQIGLRAIMSDTRHLLNQSAWASVYKQDAHQFRREIPSFLDRGGLFSEKMLQGLEILLDINQGFNQCNNIYFTVLQSMIPLLSVTPSEVSLTQLLAVMHRFKPDFYGLLQRRDLRALLLLAYWLGLMCRVDLWWISSRARSECLAYCEYLDGRGDNTVRKLLSFPAECCKYHVECDQRAGHG